MTLVYQARPVALAVPINSSSNEVIEGCPFPTPNRGLWYKSVSRTFQAIELGGLPILIHIIPAPFNECL